MNVTPFPKEELRLALQRALPEDDQITARLREPRFTYLPPGHAEALNPDAAFVEGIRGAGKSHWWAALGSPEHRRYISRWPKTAHVANLTVSQGFGVGMDPAVAPSKEILARLTQSGMEPGHIWRAVIARCVEFPPPFPVDAEAWEERVRWIRDNPETYARLEYGAGVEYERQGQKRLILFDALDRMADTWPAIRPLAKALFQLALDMLANRGIRLKLFVRPDMLEDREILAFPDSSKIHGRKAVLNWRRTDLYALAFQCLGNEDEYGGAFRADATGDWRRIEEGWALPDELRRSEDRQQDVFGRIAGHHMAAGPRGNRRGFPYSWLPNHLVDERAQVSPRSFFGALRRASVEPGPPDWPFAVHFNGIKAGAREAARIRVDELLEDYRWAGTLMEPLRGLLLPVSVDEVLQRWRDGRTLDRIEADAAEAEVKLLPPRLEEGPRAAIEALEGLGVLSLQTNGGIQMPEVYRVGFGLGRKGGMKPLQ